MGSDTASGLPESYQYTAKESNRPHPLVAEWLALHKAEAYPWRHYGEETVYGHVRAYYTRCDFGGHIVALTAYEGPEERVFFAYAGPIRKDGSMGQRNNTEFRAVDTPRGRVYEPTDPESEYTLEKTTESLRRLFPS